MREEFEQALVAIDAEDDRKRSESGPFRPTPKMRLYVLKLRGAMSNNRPVSQRAIAAESDVHEDVVSRWHKVPGFDQWMGEELYGEARRIYPLAVVAAARRAVRTGDPAEVEKVGRLLGELPAGYQSDEQQQAAAAGVAVIVNLLVPRPELPVLPAQVIQR